jgi:hypothetical protein
MASEIHYRYTTKCNTASDIHEHLPVLFEYAKRCAHITECGVREVVSSYAFAHGLLLGKLSSPKLVLVDINPHPNIDAFLELCKQASLECIFHEQSDLECEMERTDLLFIDTWHVYDQLKKELERWNKHVNKYIIMHDTKTFGHTGENSQGDKGLLPAIEEFLSGNKKWRVLKQYDNNNGLTILEKMLL